VDQQAAEQGYQGVLLALRALKGEVLPETTLIDTRLVTAETGK
jgi:ribose transport system substrate-binding protein